MPIKFNTKNRQLKKNNIVKMRGISLRLLAISYLFFKAFCALCKAFEAALILPELRDFETR